MAASGFSGYIDRKETSMGFDQILQHLSRIMQQEQVQALLVGGWSLGAYGVNRQTIDIDFVVLERDLLRMEARLSPLGYEEVFRNSLFAKLRATDGTGPDIDFLFVTEETLARLGDDSVRTDIGKATFHVPSLRHLIGMKLHALAHGRSARGTKDLADIEALARANAVDVCSQEFRELCLRYATADIHEEIRSHPQG